MSTKDSLGDRMKSLYEDAYRTSLPGRMPVILRLDGKAWHTWTRNASRPFDRSISNLIDRVMAKLFDEVQSTVFAYAQSDEISLLLHNYRKLDSGAWFENNLQKIVSVAASIATAEAACVVHKAPDNYAKDPCLFDARAFVVPESDVCNYFIWRQKDAERNSLQTMAQAQFSPKQMHGKKSRDMHEMLRGIGLNWNDLPTGDKRGRCCFRVQDVDTVRMRLRLDDNPPVFTEDRKYVEQWLKCESEETEPT